MKRFITVLCAVLALCLVLSSCDSIDVIRPVSALLSPPLYYEEYEELVDSFNKNVGNDAVLCSPKNGDFKSAIIVDDVDGDGEVSSYDARQALRASVGLVELSGMTFFVADADRDDVISASDARLILRASVGLETLK